MDRAKSWRRYARLGYLAMAWAVGVLLLVQVFLAGQAVMVDAAVWSLHRAVGHGFTLPIAAMLLLALTGRMPLQFAFYSLGLYGLYALQYVVLNVAIPWFPSMPAFHAANALLLLWATLGIAREAVREYRSELRHNSLFR